MIDAERRQAESVGRAAVEQHPVVVLRLVLGDGQEAGEIADPGRAGGAERRRELAAHQLRRRGRELLDAAQLAARPRTPGTPW